MQGRLKITTTRTTRNTNRSPPCLAEFRGPHGRAACVVCHDFRFFQCPRSQNEDVTTCTMTSAAHVDGQQWDYGNNLASMEKCATHHRRSCGIAVCISYTNGSNPSTPNFNALLGNENNLHHKRIRHSLWITRGLNPKPLDPKPLNPKPSKHSRPAFAHRGDWTHQSRGARGCLVEVPRAQGSPYK